MRTNALPKVAGRRIAAAALALCLAPAFATGAQAAEGNEGRWYFGLNIPVMFIDDTKTDVSGRTVLPANPLVSPPTPMVTTNYTADAVSKYGLGFRIAATVGYYVIPNLRLEAEAFYGFARVRKTDHRNVRGTNLIESPLTPDPIPFSNPNKVTVNVKGSAKMMGAMLNAWYDIPTESSWSPYVGGGVGVFHADMSSLKWDFDKIARENANLQQAGSGALLPEGFGPRPGTKSTVFAFQVGGGVAYKVSDETSVHLSYKFQMAPGLKFPGENDFGNTIRTKSDMRIHLVEIGFRYLF